MGWSQPGPSPLRSEAGIQQPLEDLSQTQALLSTGKMKLFRENLVVEDDQRKKEAGREKQASAGMGCKMTKGVKIHPQWQLTLLLHGRQAPWQHAAGKGCKTQPFPHQDIWYNAVGKFVGIYRNSIIHPEFPHLEVCIIEALTQLQHAEMRKEGRKAGGREAYMNAGPN